MSNVFSLTQIRHLMRVEFSRAQRYRYPLACIALTCDNLDHLRDVHGFDFKESVVDGVVDLLMNATRTCDYLGRLMDDRLLAILPHTTREGAEVLVQRLLKSVRQAKFEIRGETIDVSLSVGLSHFQDDNTIFFDSLVSAAEVALQEAMADGGDRYVHKDPGPRAAEAH